MVLQIQDVTSFHPDMFANSGKRSRQGIRIGGANSHGIGLQRRKLANRFDNQIAVLKLISWIQQPLRGSVESNLEMKVPIRFHRTRHDRSGDADTRHDELQPRRAINILSLIRGSAGRIEAHRRTDARRPRARGLLRGPVPTAGAHESEEGEYEESTGHRLMRPASPRFETSRRRICLPGRVDATLELALILGRVVVAL